MTATALSAVEVKERATANAIRCEAEATALLCTVAGVSAEQALLLVQSLISATMYRTAAALAQAP